MKAPSDIFTTVQKPFTILGVPTKLFAIITISGVVTFLLVGSALSKGVGFLLALAIIFGGNFHVAKLVKKDPHLEQRLLIARPFFKGKATRHLIPGMPRRKRQKKERAF